ncbi:MAG: hypothetical protein E6G79_20785 [Alphaproteobacteria bacterium]|nr:MAG: hypothetical protein E6G79_20785 [Alphaproteobacteria bacterium]
MRNRFRIHMLHAVEVLFSGEHVRNFLVRVRGWLDAQNMQPATFRYWLHEPETVLRVNFESHEQAHAFAQAFDGIVLG